MKTKFYIIYFIIMLGLTSCASMISGVSLTSLLSGKSIKVCPEEKDEIIKEAVNRTLLIMKEEKNDQKENT